MQKIFRKTVKVGAIILALGTISAFLSWGWIVRNQNAHGERRVKRHHLETDFFGLTQLGDVPLDYDNQDWLERAMEESIPGQLVCLRSSIQPPSKLVLARIERPGEIESEEELPRLENRRKVSITQQSSSRPIGCCPAGDPSGEVYRPGFACCHDTIFDVSKQFCCTMKSSTRLLPLNEEALNYCHPPNGIPYCRLEDFEMTPNSVMTYRCRNNSKGNPEFCEFDCPVGSKSSEGIKTAQCLRDGTWNAKPICCEGCSKDFQLDLWFLIQVPDNKNPKRIANLKEFLKGLIDDLQVSQESVRVGFDLISSELSDDNVSRDFTKHSNHFDAGKTIDALPFVGTGSRIGERMLNIAENGFSPSVGDRKEVKNLVIVIVSDPSRDAIFEGARALKNQSDIIAISIGKDVTDEDLHVLASSRQTAFRVKDTVELKNFTPRLHNHICGTNCI